MGEKEKEKGWRKKTEDGFERERERKRIISKTCKLKRETRRNNFIEKRNK